MTDKLQSWNCNLLNSAKHGNASAWNEREERWFPDSFTPLHIPLPTCLRWLISNISRLHQLLFIEERPEENLWVSHRKKSVEELQQRYECGFSSRNHWGLLSKSSLLKNGIFQSWTNCRRQQRELSLSPTQANIITEICSWDFVSFSNRATKLRNSSF